MVAACLTLAACGSETLTESDAGRLPTDGSSTVGSGRGGAGAGGAHVGAGGAAGAIGVAGASGTTGLGGASGGCNTLVNQAPVVAKFQAAANPPAPGGGPIVDGTYYLSEANTYTGPNGAWGPLASTIQDTLVITNAASGTATVQEVTSGDGGADSHASFTMTPAGTMATATSDCPKPSISVSFGYTATATTFMAVSGSQASVHTRH